MSQFTFNSVPTVCTAKHITNWTMQDVSKLPPPKQAEYYLDRLNDLKNGSGEGFLQDFAMIYVITTAEQRKNAHAFLTEVGFSEVFVGDKKRNPSKQREQGSGNLSMYCIMPVDFMDGIKLAITKYEKIKKEGMKELIEYRAKFPYLRAYDLCHEGIFKGPGQGGYELMKRLEAKEQVRLMDALAPGVDLDDLIVRVKVKFGVDLRDRKDAMTNWTVDRLKNEQQRWKDQYK